MFFVEFGTYVTGINLKEVYRSGFKTAFVLINDGFTADGANDLVL